MVPSCRELSYCHGRFKVSHLVLTGLLPRNLNLVTIKIIWKPFHLQYTHVATDQNRVPRVRVPTLSDPEGLDRSLGTESLER